MKPDYKISMVDFAYQLSLVAYNCGGKRSSLEHAFRKFFKDSKFYTMLIYEMNDNSGNANRELSMISKTEDL